ncbi:MAG: hypothetical protein JWR27_1990 [Aeromicrobium sp.]|nr:hypothetical protein [Aeromicrobium sp.]
MISRRVLLGTGAVVAGVAAALGAAEATHVLDDAAPALGVDPKPEPDPQDDRIVRAAARDQAALLAMIEATAARHPGLELAPFEAIGREHLAAVGGSTATTDVGRVPESARAAVTTLRTAYDKQSRARAAQAAAAVSPALVRVLASMSVGLAQCAVTIGDL